MKTGIWMAAALAAAGCGGKKGTTTVANQGGEEEQLAPLGEAVFPEWVNETFEADLDGDGKAEKIAFECEGHIAVNVSGVRAESPWAASELMGCGAVVLAMRPGATRQLMVASYEHEEVGPPHYVMWALEGGELTSIWEGEGELYVHQGGWTLTTTECLDEGELVITTETMRWAGKAVDTTSKVERQPIDPSGCADP